MKWERIEATQIESYDGALSDLVGSGPAIYMWKRHFKPSPSEMADSRTFMRWLNRVISAPVAELEGVKVSHFLSIRGIRLSGDLTSEKVEYLHKMAAKPSGRRIISQFVSALSEQTPALYVGETDEVSRRVREHLDGRTGFGTIINLSDTLSWDDLEFHYMSLRVTQPDSDGAKQFRTALEQIAANVTIAGLTKRAG